MVNSISPTPASRTPEVRDMPAAARETHSAAGAPETEPGDSAPGNKSSSGVPANFAAMPDGILERYYRIGTKYYLDNGELAFTHHADRLTTPSENSEIVRDLVGIAHHNGLHDITVTGTERFRREVWAAATRLGLEVRGYAPTLHDEKQLVRAMAREDAASRGMRSATRSDESSSGAAAPTVPDTIGSPPAADGPLTAGAGPALSGRKGLAANGHAAPQHRAEKHGRVYTGELLDHGNENYQRNPREDMSYYVQLATPQGTIDLWGLDLKRAIAEAKSHPTIGDRVVVRQIGQRDVTVRQREYDEAGRFIGEHDKGAHRNRWSVEKEDFVQERARLAAAVRDVSVTAKRGVNAHPQLAGTYFILKGAEEYAKRYRTREERERFLQFTRERLAQIIERGDAMPTTQIRDHRHDRTRTPSRENPAPQGPAMV